MVRQGGDKTLTLDMTLDLDVPKQTGKTFPKTFIISGFSQNPITNHSLLPMLLTIQCLIPS